VTHQGIDGNQNIFYKIEDIGRIVKAKLSVQGDYRVSSAWKKEKGQTGPT
jgi:hypothetical protein